MFRKVDRFVSHFERFVIGSTMIAMTALIFVNVFMRYFFGETITWAEDLALFLMIGMSFLAAAHGTRLNGHITMSAFYDSLSGRTRRLFHGFGLLLTSGLSALLFALSLEVTRTMYHLQGQVASMGLPKYLPYLVATVALLLMAVHFLQRTVRFFKTGNTDEPLPEQE